eukprot:TRINITY_DN3944_c0_g1_i5.p1 TRINITY_DN3944_c0_g1~~TRINITY_DN3944_c0_g1_i5.p1  ORF type:complete len:228 (-),score=44.01 TRINITY_DN3944_c0_g1_i5:79-762(-)
MEKYRKFADPGTGINPFIKATKKESFKLSRALRWIYGPPLLTVRLLIIFVMFMLLLLYHMAFRRIIFIKEIRRMTTLLVNMVCYRVILFCFGFYTIESNFQMFTKKITNSLQKMGSGQIVLCNHTSPIDIFYLSCLMSPSFTRIFFKRTPNSQQSEVLYAPLDFLETWKFALSLTYQIPPNADSDLSKIRQKKLKLKTLCSTSFDEKQGPYLIFFEGAVTNLSLIHI